MKQEVSPAVMVAIIVVVVLIVGFFGMRMLGGGKGSGDNPYAGGKQPPTSAGRNMSGGPGGPMSGGGMSGGGMSGGGMSGGAMSGGPGAGSGGR